MRDQHLQNYRVVEGCPVWRTCEKFCVHEGGAVVYLVGSDKSRGPSRTWGMSDIT